MNFTRAKNFLFKHIHTILFLLGLACVVVAIASLTNFYFGLMALGVVFIIISLMLSEK